LKFLLRETQDILDYITNGIKKVRLLKKLQGKERQELREEIIEKLKDQANGMFMYGFIPGKYCVDGISNRCNAGGSS